MKALIHRGTLVLPLLCCMLLNWDGAYDSELRQMLEVDRERASRMEKQ